MPTRGPSEMLAALLDEVGLSRRNAGEVELVGREPILPTRLPVAGAAAAVLGACGVAISDLWEHHTGRRQSSRIELQAAAGALLSFLQLRSEPPDLLSPRNPPSTIGFYRARDERWVHLHGGFPHLHEGLLRLLSCDEDPASIAAAVASWDAQELEDTIAERGLCGAWARSAEQWRAHPQGVALTAAPLVEIRRIGDAPAEPLPGGDRPLAGVRVLDLTRVLAGPTCARTLAEHGADVLRIQAPHLPSIPAFAVDTGHGKRSAHLDLRHGDAVATLRGLVRGCDVFSQGYRAGALARRGFGPEALAEIRPGIVVVSIDCYGHEGPWAERAGWEQLAQTACGIAIEQGSRDAPRLLPAAATDYTTGYLGALGAMVALGRRAREGGSYEVRVSLARTGMWLLGQDRVDGEPAGLDPTVLDRYRRRTTTRAGVIEHLGPVLEMSETLPRWDRPTSPLGSDPAQWPERPPFAGSEASPYSNAE